MYLSLYLSRLGSLDREDDSAFRDHARVTRKLRKSRAVILAVGKRMVQKRWRRREEERREERGEDDGVANMAAPESETEPCRGRARLRRDAVVIVVVDVDGDGDGDRVTAAALGDQYLDASGERRDAERRRIAPRRAAPRTKDVEFEKCYSARLSLNDMEGNASPTWVSHVCASAVRARAPRGSFARVYLPKTRSACNLALCLFFPPRFA